MTMATGKVLFVILWGATFAEGAILFLKRATRPLTDVATDSSNR